MCLLRLVNFYDATYITRIFTNLETRDYNKSVARTNDRMTEDSSLYFIKN